MVKVKYDKDLVAQRVRESRTKRNFTQKELAEKSGISVSSIKLYETGRRIPDNYNLNQLSKVLRVDKEYLLGINDYPSWISKWQSEHEEETKNIYLQLKLWNYAESLGCTFEDFDEEEANEFIESVNQFMKQKYQELKERND